MITYNAHLLAAVAIAKSEEETRYYLKGVNLDVNGRAVATDGHMLTVAADDAAIVPAGEAGIYPISKKTLAALKNRKAETAEFTDGIVRVLTKTGIVLHMEPCSPIDGTFPAWHRVMPEGPFYASPAAIAPDVLARLCATASILALDGGMHAISTGANAYHKIPGKADPTGPHFVQYGGRADIFSIAMPCRAPNMAIDMNIPAWAIVDETTSTATAAASDARTDESDNATDKAA